MANYTWQLSCRGNNCWTFLDRVCACRAQNAVGSLAQVEIGEGSRGVVRKRGANPESAGLYRQVASTRSNVRLCTHLGTANFVSLEEGTIAGCAGTALLHGAFP